MGRRAPDPEHRDLLEVAALQDRVRRVRGAQHHVGDPRAVHIAEVPRRSPRRDAGRDVAGGRHLRLRHESGRRGRAPRRRCSCRRRRSPAAGRGAQPRQHLHRLVVEVVAEGPGPGDLEASRRAPDRIAGERDDGDPLPVAEALGRDRLGDLGVEDRDQVGHRGEDAGRPRAPRGSRSGSRSAGAGRRHRAVPRRSRCRRRTRRWCCVRRRPPCRRSTGRPSARRSARRPGRSRRP